MNICYKESNDESESSQDDENSTESEVGDESTRLRLKKEIYVVQGQDFFVAKCFVYHFNSPQQNQAEY